MTAATYDILGIGNAIVDVVARTDSAFLTRHDMHKGSMRLIDSAAADALYADMPAGIESSGGSAANRLHHPDVPQKRFDVGRRRAPQRESGRRGGMDGPQKPGHGKNLECFLIGGSGIIGRQPGIGDLSANGFGCVFPDSGEAMPINFGAVFGKILLKSDEKIFLFGADIQNALRVQPGLNAPGHSTHHPITPQFLQKSFMECG